MTKRVGISFGATELATPALLSRSCAKGDLYWLAPAPDRTVRIVDENGNDCPPGQQGELRIQFMDIDCKSYIDDEETTAKVFCDGFFCPGDMAVRRADGRIRILGRTADVLNVRGRKVAVAPIELAVQHALRVDEVCLLSGLNEAGKKSSWWPFNRRRNRQEPHLNRLFVTFRHSNGFALSFSRNFRAQRLQRERPSAPL